MSPRTDFDAVVIGAGIIGAATALGLAGLGCKVAIVDHAASPTLTPSRDARGLALALSSVRVLQDLNLWATLVNDAVSIKHIHITQRAHFGALRFNHSDVGLAALGYVCSAARVHNVLATAVTNHASITEYWSAPLTTVSRNEDGCVATVSTRDGVAQLSASLLIGADGNVSKVRELLHIETTRHAYAQTAIVANVDVEFPRPNTAFERLTSAGPCAVLPLAGRRQVVIRSAKSDEVRALLELTPAEYLSDIESRCATSLGRFSDLGERTAYPLSAIRAKQVIARRCVLLGNAANAVHPNGAQGLNLGLRDVSALLRLIDSARAIGADIGNVGLLSAYAAARRMDHRATAGFSDLLAKTFSFDAPIFGALRASGMMVLDRMPVIKRALLRRLIGNAAWA